MEAAFIAGIEKARHDDVDPEAVWETALGLGEAENPVKRGKWTICPSGEENKGGG